MHQQVSQYVDEDVTRQKFQQELDGFKKQKAHYRSIGVFLLEEEYPNAYFGFAAIKLNPIPFVFAVKINFTNYDVEPLSVRFVHAVTFQPLTADQVPTKFLRRIDVDPGVVELLQADRDRIPFLCFAGVREYHDHTFHTGDSWFLYRKKGGEGSLCFLLDNLQLYGTSSIAVYHYPINLTVPNMNLISNPALIPK